MKLICRQCTNVNRYKFWEILNGKGVLCKSCSFYIRKNHFVYLASSLIPGLVYCVGSLYILFVYFDYNGGAFNQAQIKLLLFMIPVCFALMVLIMVLYCTITNHITRRLQKLVSTQESNPCVSPTDYDAFGVEIDENAIGEENAADEGKAIEAETVHGDDVKGPGEDFISGEDSNLGTAPAPSQNVTAGEESVPGEGNTGDEEPVAGEGGNTESAGMEAGGGEERSATAYAFGLDPDPVSPYSETVSAYSGPGSDPEDGSANGSGIEGGTDTVTGLAPDEGAADNGPAPDEGANDTGFSAETDSGTDSGDGYDTSDGSDNDPGDGLGMVSGRLFLRTNFRYSKQRTSK